MVMSMVAYRLAASWLSYGESRREEEKGREPTPEQCVSFQLGNNVLLIDFFDTDMVFYSISAHLLVYLLLPRRHNPC